MEKTVVNDILGEVLKNKEDLLLKVLDIMEGKEAKAKVKLGGLEFEIGDSKVQLAGTVELTFVPHGKKR